MDTKPTYEELEQRIVKLEQRTQRYNEFDLVPIFKGIENSFPLGITDQKGIIIYVNDPLLKMWGYSSEKEIIGRGLAEFWEGDGIFSTIDDLINTGWSMGEDIGKRKDGSLFNADYVAIMCKDNNGEPLYMLVQFFDITKRKQSEEALQESEARYRELFVSNPQPMWIYDLESLAYLDVNNAAIAHYGYSREEFLSMTLKDIRPAEDVPRLVDNIDRVNDGLDTAGIWRHIRKDGTVIQVEITSHVLLFHERQAEMVLIRDITEQRKTEAEREKLQAQLLQAQKMEAIGTLAGGVAHDFNNMLGVIIGHAEMMFMGIKPGDDYYTDLQEIYKAAQRSADLTRQLLAFARKQTITPRVLDLNDTVEGMLMMLRRLIGEDIDLAWKPDTHLWPVKVDPAQVDQILVNLCVNARDAISGTGKVTIETVNVVFDQTYCATHAGFKPGQYVMLAVSDDGYGMDTETLENLFEPFFTTKKVGEGTGLGLAMIYGIVKQNKGFINVYSEPGQGTTFKLYLPRTREAEDAIAETVAKTVAKGSETVLLVEDEESILRLGKAVLEQFGYKVLPAGTPEQALVMAERYEGPIHLLVTDVVMPKMNGKELMERLKKLRPHIKVLFMSGYTGNVIVHRGILEDDVQFLQKPFSINSLVGKVREVLDQQE
jgi:PAS domain S-box-containing protein